MSEKKAKRARRIARYLYKGDLRIWQRNEPPKWRIFRHKRWERCKPVYKDIERYVKGW